MAHSGIPNEDEEIEILIPVQNTDTEDDERSDNNMREKALNNTTLAYKAIEDKPHSTITQTTTDSTFSITSISEYIDFKAGG